MPKVSSSLGMTFAKANWKKKYEKRFNLTIIKGPLCLFSLAFPLDDFLLLLLRMCFGCSRESLKGAQVWPERIICMFGTLCVLARMSICHKSSKAKGCSTLCATQKKLKFVKLIRRQTQIAWNSYEVLSYLCMYVHIMCIFVCLCCHECGICVRSWNPGCEVHAVLIKYVFVHFDVYFGS